MRRTIAMLSVLGGLGAGLGCQHIGGKCDCQAHPSDSVILPPSAPYAAIPVAALPALPAADKDKGKVEPKPETPKPDAKKNKNEESNEAAPEFKPSGEK